MSTESHGLPAATPAPERGDGPVPLQLPAKVPVQQYRQAQSNIPDDKSERVRLKQATAAFVEDNNIVPPLSIAELREHSAAIVASTGIDTVYQDFVAVLVNNESWRETIARIPYERRLLLVPKCLRVEEHCPAPFDQFGMLCKECGLCSIEDLTREAEALGYAVLIAEGSAIVTAMIETGKIEAIVGVSCLNVLEKCFPHLEAVAIPGMSIPLLQDDCIDTNVDIDQVQDLIHLTARDRTYRLDLEGLKTTVRSWFTPESLDTILGEVKSVDGATDALARAWLGRSGKRWRPYLATSLWVALSSEGKDEAPVLPDDLKKLAVAVECFHKASLIHDDIEDGDALRYGEATLHEEHGVPVALNVGDLLLGEGYRLISELEASGDVRAAMMRVAALGHVTLSRGQGAELTWARAPRPLSSLEVLGIFREKTAPAFEVALRLGALFAGASDEVLDVLGPYSEALGIAYQIHDDLDDYTGHGDSDDLADLRPSLILAIACKRAQAEADQDYLASVWRRETRVGPPGSPERKRLEAILGGAGVISKARELSDAYERQAIDALGILTHASAKGLLRRVIGKIFGDGDLIPGYCGEFEKQNLAARAATTTPAD